ncbi:MAG TPA: hypothetical protein EYH22_00730 [Candidatus Nanopusillus sp.]|nr:hypothetical protein [Candidatus Nanopusillus sp.]
MGLLESIKYAFIAYKEKIGEGMLYSIILSILNILWFIPIIGPIILAFIYPTVLRKIADEWKLSIDSMDTSETRKVALIVMAPMLILHIVLFGVIIDVLSHTFSGAKNSGALLTVLLSNITIIAICILIALVVSALFLYSFYALVLGKERRIVIDVKKSISIMIFGIILGVMGSILSMIVSVIPVIGSVIEMILYFLVFPVIGALAVLHYTRSL